jgi:ribonuclease HI
MRCFFFFLFLALPITAIAADAATDQSAAIASHQASNCGVTAADALKLARASLAQKDATSQRAALECLVEALSRIEAEKITITRDSESHVLAVPQSTGSFK